MIKATSLVSRGFQNPFLVQGRDYLVIEISEQCFRVIDDLGEPCEHPKDYFLDWEEIRAPEDWCFRDYGAGRYRFFPREFSTKGIWEDFFDGNEQARQAVKEYVAKHPIDQE